MEEEQKKLSPSVIGNHWIIAIIDAFVMYYVMSEVSDYSNFLDFFCDIFSVAFRSIFIGLIFGFFIMVSFGLNEILTERLKRTPKTVVIKILLNFLLCISMPMIIGLVRHNSNQNYDYEYDGGIKSEVYLDDISFLHLDRSCPFVNEKIKYVIPLGLIDINILSNICPVCCNVDNKDSLINISESNDTTRLLTKDFVPPKWERDKDKKLRQEMKRIEEEYN